MSKQDPETKSVRLTLGHASKIQDVQGREFFFFKFEGIQVLYEH